MESLVNFFEALQYLDSVLCIWRSDLDGFKVLAEPVPFGLQFGEAGGRRRADALNLARYDRSLQQVGDLKRSYRGDSPRSIMHPVQEKDLPIACCRYKRPIQFLVP